MVRIDLEQEAWRKIMLHDWRSMTQYIDALWHLVKVVEHKDHDTLVAECWLLAIDLVIKKDEELPRTMRFVPVLLPRVKPAA